MSGKQAEAALERVGGKFKLDTQTLAQSCRMYRETTADPPAPQKRISYALPQEEGNRGKSSSLS